MEIRLEGVTFGYGGTAVLRGIDLVLDEPGLVCIIGPNGVGKSTLVKCINRLLEPQEGRVLIDGRDVSEMTHKELARIVSYVPPATSDLFNMNVVDAVLLGREGLGGWRTTAEDLEVVTRTLELLDLSEYASRGFNQLSAGQHQRVSIARGLARETDVMILDEPTSNLDVKHQVYVTQMLKAVAEATGKLIIMICHDLNIAAKYSDKLVVMAPPGVIRGVGTPEEMISADTIREVYGIDCEVVQFDGAPQVLLKSEFPDRTNSCNSSGKRSSGKWFVGAGQSSGPIHPGITRCSGSPYPKRARCWP